MSSSEHRQQAAKFPKGARVSYKNEMGETSTHEVLSSPWLIGGLWFIDLRGVRGAVDLSRCTRVASLESRGAPDDRAIDFDD